jgi:hypothetical protein
MRDFTPVADALLPNRGRFHIAILLVSALMVPGLIASLTPIDIESYDLDSPELTANRVLNEDFASAEVTYGFMITVRNPSAISAGNEAPHVDEHGRVIREQFPVAAERISYAGPGEGTRGDGVPLGGILNLTVLREIDAKVQAAHSDPIAPFFAPLVSELTGEGVHGVLALPDQFRAFMANESMLTRPSLDAEGNLVPARADWSDCGVLQCLTFDDASITQAHIDLAANRLVMSSEGIFMRWMSNDRGFHPDPDSPVIGPVGGTLGADGEFKGAVWMPGRWSASSTWLLVQVDREDMEANGYTFSWADARSEDGYVYDGMDLLVNPPHNTPSDCLESVDEGDGPCSAEWAIIALEENLRITDQETVTILVGDGINVEVNRELQESIFLLAAMIIAVLILLYFSLRRLSDVAIVATTLGFSLLWMQGLIGWFIILGNQIDVTFISRSQFSNLLPILILALGIDDSLHALHRYKEERRAGNDCEQSAHTALSRVGRAIMLTSFTTIAAFAANLTSSIAALRSFGLEAALGVFAAFILTGLWAPLLRLDLDLFLERRSRLREERDDQLHMVPEHWLSRITGASAWAAPLVLVLALLITAVATPIMLTLEGDFKVEDFLDEESDFAQGVEIVNTRFTDEGEPAAIVIEGDILDPRVYAAIGETRDNMDIRSPEDPDRFTRTPTGKAELHAVDELVVFAIASYTANKTPFVEAGWNLSAADHGVECPTTMVGLPDTTERGCLAFFYGFIFVHGIPEGGIIPEIPASIPRLYILPDCALNTSAVHRCVDGGSPRYERMTLRWGLTQPEQFTIVEGALDELGRDLSPFANLSSSPLSERSSLSSGSEEYPVTWGIATGQPVIRYIAASSMQNEMQGALMLGVFFCLLTLWWGFRPAVNQAKAAWRQGKEEVALLATYGVLAAFGLGMAMSMIYGSTVGGLCALAVFVLTLCWGERALGVALITTCPILIVVIWLYGMIAAAGYGLNMVTVAIAAMSLGVGIDYVIHVVERYREERDKGHSVHASLVIMGGASGLALVGSAVSDITGFGIISLSSMGFFASFGLFCAVMIGLSLIASMVIASAVLGALHWRELRAEIRRAGGFRQLQLKAEGRDVSE